VLGALRSTPQSKSFILGVLAAYEKKEVWIIRMNQFFSDPCDTRAPGSKDPKNPSALNPRKGPSEDGWLDTSLRLPESIASGGQGSIELPPLNRHWRELDHAIGYCP
jgi:hypothetical protein